MNQHDLLYTDLDRLAAVVAEFGIDVVEPALVDALADQPSPVAPAPPWPASSPIRPSPPPPVSGLSGRLAVVAARPAPTPVLTAA
ncbi:MAG: hypothetical protein R2697_18355 [Ilumatobacteraceae bacterium]